MQSKKDFSDNAAFALKHQRGVEDSTWGLLPDSYETSYIIKYDTSLPFTDVVEAVQAVVDQLDICIESSIVHAHSMGGLISSDVFFQKHRPASLVLYDSPVTGLHQSFKPFLSKSPDELRMALTLLGLGNKQKTKTKIAPGSIVAVAPRKPKPSSKALFLEPIVGSDASEIKRLQAALIEMDKAGTHVFLVFLSQPEPAPKKASKNKEKTKSKAVEKGKREKGAQGKGGKDKEGAKGKEKQSKAGKEKGEEMGKEGSGKDVGSKKGKKADKDGKSKTKAKAQPSTEPAPPRPLVPVGYLAHQWPEHVDVLHWSINSGEEEEEVVPQMSMLTWALDHISMFSDDKFKHQRQELLDKVHAVALADAGSGKGKCASQGEEPAVVDTGKADL